MRKLFRSILGKTIAFIAFVLSVCIVIASVAGAVLMVSETPYNFYTNTEETLVNKLAENHFVSNGYSILWEALYENRRGYADGDFYWRITDNTGKEICRSSDWARNPGEVYSYIYATKKNDAGYTDIIYLEHLIRSIDDEWETVNLELSGKDGSPKATEFAIIMKLMHVAYGLRYAIYGIGIAAILFAIASFIVLMSNAGHRPDTEEIMPGPLYRIPFDLELGICVAGGIMAIFIGDTLNSWFLLAYIVIVCIIGLCIALGLCISAAVRLKLHTLITNTIIYRFIKLGIKVLLTCWKLFKRFISFLISLAKSIPIVWKTVLILLGLYLVEVIIVAAGYYSSVILICLTLEQLVLFPTGIYIAICLKKLQKSGEALAQGNLSHVTDTKGLFLDLKKHGENLNNIAVGMAIAVDDRMKSERMRTELITNVSHDIKTPLTSIINYATLIGQEPCENPKITEYSEVLVRQSARMKRLIEDLVEASKASTGNLEVNLAPCEAATFIAQAAGEYEDKMNKAELTLITKQPDKDIRILADGRRMWRVFDNLMNNICKYAQSGTRVYLSLEEINGNAVFTFKNTSRDPLDMSEEELMERFARGDASRNTEGNGLGLSIAKSMAELQNGTLRLSIDGDLFKAILTFPSV